MGFARNGEETRRVKQASKEAAYDKENKGKYLLSKYFVPGTGHRLYGNSKQVENGGHAAGYCVDSRDPLKSSTRQCERHPHFTGEETEAAEGWGICLGSRFWGAEDVIWAV